ncbi:hypothetical protein Ana3638_12475 [Anaerocolumna sedimenticola]|uniref:GyrI-like small molecule binding domain-containing protein n=1 Tax=Anaerocolumna sedimenticola TaxID=2696063 RepID=A0A6P1TJW3_9FIRM|nr:hypothetical protein [Anaerocolumna sedimenticola]QHQ61490.1 hypothetical protein Ana3638_12475 [Anaerocolumna sedimenticola]
MNCKLLFLKEQKYMGIMTKILFKEHDEIDFRKLHINVINSDIKNRDVNERFMALDSDFQPDSFTYTPLVPVTSFEGEEYYRYTRIEGEYYCFEVHVKELGPKWFQECNEYIEQNNLKIDRLFDMEYYAEDYLSKVKSEDSNLQDQRICVIFRKVD